MWVAACEPKLILRCASVADQQLVNCVSICPGFEKAKFSKSISRPCDLRIGRWSCDGSVRLDHGAYTDRLCSFHWASPVCQPSLKTVSIEKPAGGDKRVFVSMHPFVDKRLDFPYYCRLKSIVISGLHKIKIELRSLKFLGHPPLKMCKFVVVRHPRVELVAIFPESSRERLGPPNVDFITGFAPAHHPTIDAGFLGVLGKLRSLAVHRI